MEAVLQRIETPPEVSWQLHVRREAHFDFHWHYHPECELTLITHGTGRRFVGDSVEEYGPGDLVLMAPNLPHTYASEGNSAHAEAIVIHFRPDFLGAPLFAGPDLAPIREMLTRAARGLARPAQQDAGISELLAQLGARPGPERTIGLLDVLLRLARLETRALASRGYQPSYDSASSRRLDDMCRHLHAHFADPVTLSEIARVAHMTPAACSRFFHRAMGRTLTGYLTELRIGAACRMLASTDRPVAEIAATCGYPNLANFNRRFRLLKATTPTDYRAAFHGTSRTR
jgi:AraC-like DNA-binding protein